MPSPAMSSTGSFASHSATDIWKPPDEGAGRQILVYAVQKKRNFGD
jgi:hypothetical protein